MSDADEFINAVRNGIAGKRTGETARPHGQPPGVEGNADWAKTIAAAACWAQSGQSYFPVSEVVNAMPAGAYKCCISNTGPYFEKMKIEIDDLLNLPDSATQKLLGEFTEFWKLKPAFDKRGFTFKRGILMWGAPGSGKTSAVWQMTQHLVSAHNGLLIFIQDPQVAIWCLTALRRIEPHRPIVTVMEDLDALVAQYGEHHLLALLDGEYQFSKVVHLATTNYPDRLDRRFIDRPSRFDTIMKVGMPSEAARELYFRTKEPELDDATIRHWVRRSEGYSIAHMREVCIATQCFKQDQNAVFDRLDKMKQLFNLNEDGEEREPAGFVVQRHARIG